MQNGEFELPRGDLSKIAETIVMLRKIRSAGLSRFGRRVRHPRDPQDALSDAAELTKISVGYLLDLPDDTTARKPWLECLGEAKKEYRHYEPFSSNNLNPDSLANHVKGYLRVIREGKTATFLHLLRLNFGLECSRQRIVNERTGIFVPLSFDYLMFAIYVEHFRRAGNPCFVIQPSAVDTEGFGTVLRHSENGSRIFEGFRDVTGAVDMSDSGRTRQRLMLAIGQEYPDKIFYRR